MKVKNVTTHEIPADADLFVVREDVREDYVGVGMCFLVRVDTRGVGSAVVHKYAPINLCGDRLVVDHLRAFDDAWGEVVRWEGARGGEA